MSSKLNGRFTKILITYDPNMWLMKGSKRDELKLTLPLSTAVFLAESWAMATLEHLTFFNVSMRSKDLPWTFSNLFLIARYIYIIREAGLYGDEEEASMSYQCW